MSQSLNNCLIESNYVKIALIISISFKCSAIFVLWIVVYKHIKVLITCATNIKLLNI